MFGKSILLIATLLTSVGNGMNCSKVLSSGSKSHFTSSHDMFDGGLLFFQEGFDIMQILSQIPEVRWQPIPKVASPQISDIQKRVTETLPNVYFDTQQHLEVYSEKSIDDFIEHAISLDISTKEKLEEAIVFGMKAFWGRSDLVDDCQKILTTMKKDTPIETNLNQLLDNRVSGDNEMANQILLWNESLFRQNSAYITRCVFWSAVCKNLGLAQGKERFDRYTRIWSIYTQFT